MSTQYHPSNSGTAVPHQIVHIIGSGHSGSTLLDMILGGHSLISSLGEASFLHYNVREHKALDVCTCGLHVLECPFWSSVETAAALQLHTSLKPALTSLELADSRLFAMRDADGRFRKRRPGETNPFRSVINETIIVVGSRWLRRVAALVHPDVARHRKIARDTITLYELVRTARGTPIVLDSTKNPGTFKGVFIEADIPMKFILLVRDGRAVCWSRIRRENVTMEQAASAWLAEHRKRAVAQRGISDDAVLTVRYEDLASAPVDTVKHICEFLGVSFESMMLDFRRDRHNLGGNPMRFREQEGEIELDEKWRTGLSKNDLDTFDNVAGQLNRHFGYK